MRYSKRLLPVLLASSLYRVSKIFYVTVVILRYDLAGDSDLGWATLRFSKILLFMERANSFRRAEELSIAAITHMEQLQSWGQSRWNVLGMKSVGGQQCEKHVFFLTVLLLVCNT